MAEEDAPMFKSKETSIDWGFVLGLKEKGVVEKLVKADADGDNDALETLMAEVDGTYGKLANWKVDKDDALANVDNMQFLFELTQSVMEIKHSEKEEAEEDQQKTKDKLKAMRVDLKEANERIGEQDKNIEELQEEVTSALTAATPSKGKGGPVDEKAMQRLNVEMSSLKKKLEAMDEDLKDKERSSRELRTQLEDANAIKDKAEEENRHFKAELDGVQKEIEQVQRKAADDEKKQQKARAQAQKTTKEAFKFVKEIGDLSRRNEELEDLMKENQDRLEHFETNNQALTDELSEVRGAFEGADRDKDDRDRECEQLRNKVAELTLHDEELEEERELLLQRVTKEIQDMKRELETKTKDLDDRERELNEATAT
ncbi:hypothetical protein T484DRAFT_1798226, partial [Baffinella frigidus]